MTMYGKHHTKKTRELMSKNHYDGSGKNNPFYGKHHSEKSKRRMSFFRKNKTYGEFYGIEKARRMKEKMSLIRKGKLKSEEHKRKIGDGNRGKIRSKEVKKRISKTKKRLYKEGKTKHPRGMLGKHFSEETKRKISLANSGKKNYMYGRHHSLEAIKKIKEARKKQILPTHHTNLELKFLEIIKKFKLPYRYTGNGSFWIESFNPDFVECNGKKICIEIFGSYWHNSKINKHVKFKDTEYGRKLILKKYGWKCIVIWDKELDNEREILKKLKLEGGEFYGRENITNRN